MSSNTPNPHRRGGVWMLTLAWLTIIGGFYWYFSDWNARQHNPNTAQVLRGQQGDLTLIRNRAGHYVADGEINGQHVTFLLDTGATAVVLPAALARELSIRRGAAVTVQTANGAAEGYETRLDSVRLGPLEMRDVAAIVAGGMDSSTVLLGMSFLRRVDFTQSGDRLTLRGTLPPR
jgi:aspartyl protease family protein